MGTFLFLGPTGVGKTETAKALAECLFGDENAMTRLDMSEFQSEDALEKLIGQYGTGKSGVLEGLIRKRQYGVLLLDEFEKSSTNVHDLFLQILDEGHFTDASGKSINMRNLVIIATSNAGADLIWKWEKEKKSVAESKRTLVDHIIKNNLFRPELLNRFDDIIVFHVLKKKDVKQIATIHLKNFAKRILKTKNIKINITEDLITRVAEKGYDPQFGGRPLERAIQNEVEQMLADTILSGKLKAGDVIDFHDPELAKKLAKELLQEVAKDMQSEHNISLTVNDALINHIVSQGYNPNAVSGSIKKAVKINVDNFIQKTLSSGKLKAGDTIEYKT